MLSCWDIDLSIGLLLLFLLGRVIVEKNLSFLVVKTVIIVNFLIADTLDRGELVRIDEAHVGIVDSRLIVVACHQL